MKVAPLYHELRRRAPSLSERGKEIHQFLVHTGQHYDPEMVRFFFKDLSLPKPDWNLEVGSGSHAVQTAAVLTGIEPILDRLRPDLLVVVGDVNSTLATALAAAKACWRGPGGGWTRPAIAHIEAGLRSFDPTMPEEINRCLTDNLSDYLFTHSGEADENLRREGILADRIFRVGNIMIDSLLGLRERALHSQIRFRLGLMGQGRDTAPYAVVTLHRPSNVDNPQVLGRILNALRLLGQKLRVIFPVHPRTRARIHEFCLEEFLCDAPVPEEKGPGLLALEPLGYVDFLALLMESRLVLTDSGGIQEETTALGVPCLTLRSNTERPITVEMGTNMLVGNDPERILKESVRILEEEPRVAEPPPLWDGQTALRIADVLIERLC
jgi:UDP-N-acetylglucosamine 2-epimerase (non-hydrolysing)